MTSSSSLGKLHLEGQDQTALFNAVLDHLKNNKPDVRPTNTVDLVQAERISDAKTSSRDGALLLIKCDDDNGLEQDACSFYQQIRAFSNCGFIIALPVTDGLNKTVDRKNAIQETFSKAESQWNTVLSEEVSQLSILPSSKATSDRLTTLETWLKATITCTVLNPSALKTEEEIKIVLSEIEATLSQRLNSNKVSIVTADQGAPTLRLSLGNNSHLPSKPPTLHWSEVPLPEEAQLTWRFYFPCVQPPEIWVQDLIAMCSRESLDSEYIYRWSQGVLLQFETAKVCVSTIKSTLNLSVRCDPEEIGDCGSPPQDILWQFIQPHLNCAFQSLIDIPKLPYQISLLPFGTTYFGTCIPQEVSFPLTSIFSSIGEGKSMLEVVTKDKSNDTHYTRLFLDKLFPGTTPTNFEELKLSIRSSLTRSRSQRKSSNPSAGMNPTHLMASPRVTTEAESGQSPTKRRMSYDGRRRVSFGHVLIEDAKKLSLDAAPAESPPSPQLAAKQAAEKVRAALNTSD